MRSLQAIACALALTCASSSAFALDIVLVPGPMLSANPAALAAFNRGAAQWETRLNDPITVTMNADIAPMDFGAAMTQSFLINENFNFVRNRMVTDALDEGPDDLIVASLPTYETFTATLPPGSSLNGLMRVTKANLKALGVAGLDDFFGASDGTLTFNSAVAWDNDNSNGVGPGLRDFETAAVHEIGHALGFFSAAGTSGALLPRPLDLFRFENGSASVDPTEATFATTPRSLTAGGVPIFDDGVNEWLMSNGTDGTQIGHWKADNLAGNYIGVMDPNLPFSTVRPITNADLRAFDLVGYDLVTVPEPAGVVALTLCATGLRRRRIHRR